MARNRTAAVANQVAYDLGYRGVQVSAALLRSQVQDSDDVEWRKRREVLVDRVSSSNFHHWSLVLTGAVLFALALYVDYAIIHEFWSRLLANEFGEVPASMATTVAAKSAQVLFATLAIHYLISHWGPVVRRVYSMVVFGVAFAMLLGIGIIWANNSMPEGTKVFATETTASARALEDFSRSMGVAPAAKPQVAEEVAVLRDHETAIRLLSLSVIFIIVASIGAIGLDSSLRAFSAYTGGAVYDNHTEAELGRRLNAEFASFAAEDPSIRRGRSSAGNRAGGRAQRTTDAKVNEFLTSYTAGIVDSKLDASRTEKLLSNLMAASNAVVGVGNDEAEERQSRLRAVS